MDRESLLRSLVQGEDGLLFLRDGKAGRPIEVDWSLKYEAGLGALGNEDGTRGRSGFHMSECGHKGVHG